jgi:hypothetical protein
MNDNTLDALTYYGSIPSNMLYWANIQDPNQWTANATTNTWEIEVNFDD